MAMIYVKTKPGRKLFYEGKIIPQDKFIPVTDDPFIRRLIHHWDDLEVEGASNQSRKRWIVATDEVDGERPDSAGPRRRS